MYTWMTALAILRTTTTETHGHDKRGEFKREMNSLWDATLSKSISLNVEGLCHLNAHPDCTSPISLRSSLSRVFLPVKDKL